MVNRIDEKFRMLRKQKQKALITFITAGDPDLLTTAELVLRMEQSGADIVELGIPFSDPIAEGPVIQEANLRALAGGATLVKIFDMVRTLREKTQIPLVFLMYYNSILHFGEEAFFKACAGSGVDGLIVPDLPFEESAELKELTEKYGVYQISMVAPTSCGQRMERITKQAKGFLYCVSSLGVTGMRTDFQTDFDKMFHTLNAFSDVPKCLGFGISSPEQSHQLRQYGDGVIVGSAVVQRVAQGRTEKEKLQSVAAFTKALKESLLD